MSQAHIEKATSLRKAMLSMRFELLLWTGHDRNYDILSGYKTKSQSHHTHQHYQQQQSSYIPRI